MNNQSAITRVLLAPLMFWLILLIGGSYFMISFDKMALQEPQKESGVIGYARHLFGAMKWANINKGIDLAGGIYLVLSVELEKALETRLGLENRTLDQLFKDKGLKILPKSRKVKDRVIEIVFEDENAAKSCYNMLVDNRGGVLKTSRSGIIVEAVLAPDVAQGIKTGAVEQTVSVLNNRLGNYGVEGIIVQQHGERRVVVQLPGVDDPDRVKSVVSKTAQLEFKIVEDTGSSKEALLDKFDGELPTDKMIIRNSKGGDEERGSWYLVSAFPDMTGDRIVDAKVVFDEYNKPVVSFRLDGTGAQEFSELTGNNVGRQLGIVIDGEMYSTPNISCEIHSEGQITNPNGNQKEALDLSIVLKSGSLQAPLKFEQESRVGASLGQDSINRGFMSCIIALLMLFIFSLFYYKIPGFFAILALLYNLFLILLFLAYFNATLTLPGIAGMVVTIGMAIDASVLIYERILEEMRAGESFRMSIDKGFKSAMAVILDSNITTFLTGLILFQFGGPAIKGFAVTLMAGIIATVLAGVFFLKSLFTFVVDTLRIKKLRF
jgi:preprotein translocase subunit SecD